jgi:hypothetical protein
MSSLNILPADILLLIINDLDLFNVIKLLKVNKYFNNFIENNKYYIYSKSLINIYDMDDKDINYLINKFPNIKHRYYLRNSYNEQDYYKKIYCNNHLLKYNDYIYDINLRFCKNINNDIINIINSSSIAILDLSYSTQLPNTLKLLNNNNITKLTLMGYKTYSLDFLKFCRNIKYIDLSTSYVVDISALSMLENVNYINLHGCKKLLLDFTFIEKCKTLDTLILSNTNITDTSNIKNIKYINLSNTNIISITDVGKVDELNLSYCKLLIDVSKLKNSQINFLSLNGCKINDISMLSHINIIKL